MDAAAPENGADSISVQASVSYTDPGGIVQSDSGSQSVQTAHTQGTHGTATRSHPNSPKRGQHTPMSTSPASASTPSQASVRQDVLGTMEPMPQYAATQHHGPPPPPSLLPQPRQQQHPGDAGFLLGMRQLERQALDHSHMPVQVMHRQQQQQQQQGQQPPHLHRTYPANRDRSNPVSDDEQTEQSSSVNTGAEVTTTNSGAAAGGYTRSDTGATSTFGRLIQNATKVRSTPELLLLLMWLLYSPCRLRWLLLYMGVRTVPSSVFQHFPRSMNSIFPSNTTD
jgi:hypothetical protein